MPRVRSYTPHALLFFSLAGGCNDGGRATDSAATAGSTSTTGSTGTGSASEGVPTGSGGATEGTSAEPTTTTTTTTTVGTGTTGEPPANCGEDPPKGYVGPFDAACAVEPSVGVFTPVLEWRKQAWTGEPSAVNCRNTPMVVQLSDDDGDGAIDEGDAPDLTFLTYSGGGVVLRGVSGDGATELFNVPVANMTGTSNVAAGDIDGDGVVEMVLVNQAGVVIAYEHTGAQKWMSAAIPTHVGGYYNAPAISDLDGDGVQEVVVGDAVYDFTGATVWYNGEPDGFPAVADLDKDGVPEIIVVTDGELRAQSSVDGKVLWKAPVPAQRGGPPTIADLDGDGLPEIGVASINFYTAYDGDGSVMWENATIDVSSGVTGSSVYDFEGDGVAEIVYADEHDLWVFAGDTGAVKLKFEDHNSATGLEYPTIADVDDDGEVEIIFCSEAANGPFVGVAVIGDMNHSWRPGRKVWNQHAYHITNVDDAGGVPAMAAQNWKSYNNFRSGDLSLQDGLSAPDLQLVTPEVCENTCVGVDSVDVWVQLGNTGAVPLTAGVALSVVGTSMGVEQPAVALEPWDGVLQPGEFTDAFTRTVVTTGLDSFRLVAAPKEVECKVDAANELVFEAPFCTPPG